MAALVRRPGQAKAEKPGNVKEPVPGHTGPRDTGIGAVNTSGHSFCVWLEADMGWPWLAWFLIVQALALDLGCGLGLLALAPLLCPLPLRERPRALCMKPWTHGQIPGFIFVKFNGLPRPGPSGQSVGRMGAGQSKSPAKDELELSTVQWGCGALTPVQVRCEVYRAGQMGLQTAQCS